MANFDAESFLNELKRLSEMTPEQQQAVAVERILKRTEAGDAQALRLCAIPHDFDLRTLRVLLPAHVSPELVFERLAEIPLVVDLHRDRMAVEDSARTYLFRQWLEPGSRAEFAAASARLYEDYEARVQEALKAAAGMLAESSAQSRTDDAEACDALPVAPFALVAASMFHLLGAQQEKGFELFLQLISEKRHAFRLGDCEFLIRLVREYDRVLTSEQLAYVRYCEGKLALDRRDLDAATNIFHEVYGAGVGPEIRARALLRLGDVEAEHRQWSKAIDNYQLARQVLRGHPSEIKDKVKLRHRTFQAIGVAFRESGQLAKAEKYLNRAARFAQKLSDRPGIAISNNSLGTLYRQLGEYTRAVLHYRLSLDELDEYKNRFQRAQVYNNIGMAYLDLRHWPESIDYFGRSIKIKLEVGDTAGVARSYNNLVRAYRNMPWVKVADGVHTPPEAGEGAAPPGEHGSVSASGEVSGSVKAVEAARHSLKLFKEVHDYYEAGVVSRNLGRLYRSLGNKKRALMALRRAERLFKKTDPTCAPPEAQAVSEEIKMLKRGWVLPIWLWIAIFLAPTLIVGFILLVWLTP